MLHEIIKHTRKIKDTVEEKEKSNSFREKVQDILIELVIIIFAVSLSTWFHDLGEQRLHKKEVKSFLIDLKVDLKNDIVGLENQKLLLLKQIENFKFARNLNGKRIDSLNRTNSTYRINTDLRLFFGEENSGNYESFESGGKTAFIENKKLKILILSYYKQHITAAQKMGEIFIVSFTKITDFITKNIVVERKKNIALLNSSFQTEVEISIKHAKENIRIGDIGIKKIREIMKEIDRELEK